MATVEEDLILVSDYAIAGYGPGRKGIAAVEDALTRIRAALGDMSVALQFADGVAERYENAAEFMRLEHLERGARIAYDHLDYRTANRRPLSGGEAAWLDAERARQSGKWEE